MDLAGKKVLIVAGPTFEDRELFYPYYRFLEAGAKVTVAGIGEKKYTGKYGVPVDVDAQTKDLVKDKWEIVIIPGGFAPDKIRVDEPTLKIVSDTLKADRIVAAICHGPWVLVNAEVCKGRKLTSYANIKLDLINAGATWVDEDVVIDRGLITSRTPADLPAFCHAIIKEAQALPV
ncbi:MAG: type 1 glutamine amidotransferase domain-containing protein [Candidatus Melainabacteria bacterium]|nr:type 1 glutamine amidotransferase domain-containing protein [Candidatus Melainabacteria bacterium]